MTRYNKLFAGIIGNLIGIVAAYMATHFSGFAECTVADGVETCTILGLSTMELTAAVMMLFNAVFIYKSPANAP